VAIKKGQVRERAPEFKEMGTFLLRQPKLFIPTTNDTTDWAITQMYSRVYSRKIVDETTLLSSTTAWSPAATRPIHLLGVAKQFPAVLLARSGQLIFPIGWLDCSIASVAIHGRDLLSST
jgi:hypothetical protein